MSSSEAEAGRQTAFVNLRTFLLVGEIASVACSDEVSLQLKPDSHLPSQLAPVPLAGSLVLPIVLKDVLSLPVYLLLSHGYGSEVDACVRCKGYVSGA